MRFLSEQNIKDLEIDWREIILQIEHAVICMEKGDFSQPIKPYLKFKNSHNRIIAMPAYVGGNVNLAGIKWISSFPGNIMSGKARADCTIILNDPQTGKAVGMIHSPLISMIRTAGVSGLMIKYYKRASPLDGITVGIIGAGPVGKCHYHMCREILKNEIHKILLYDTDIERSKKFKKEAEDVILVNSWEEAYRQADILITATVSNASYINERPVKKMLALNVSLRDFQINAVDLKEDAIIVDNWEEVCRENTDIENLYKIKGLAKKDTKTIIDVVCNEYLKYTKKNKMIFFNPMGMAVFDVAIGAYYFDKAEQREIGSVLEDD